MQVMIVQDQGTMNIEPQMPVKITLRCHHSTMYVQQYLLGRLIFFEAFVITLCCFIYLQMRCDIRDLQMHCYNRSFGSDIFLLFPCKTIPWLVYCCEEVSLSVVDHWKWPSISGGPMLCTCSSKYLILSLL